MPKPLLKLFPLLLLILFYGASVDAAVSFTGARSTTGSLVSSITLAHTVTGVNRLVVVHVGLRPGGFPETTVSGVTYAGKALTRAGTITNSAILSEIWYLANPPFGTANVVVSFSNASGNAVVGVTSWSGVNQATPVGTAATKTGSGARHFVNVASNPKRGDAVVSVQACDDASLSCDPSTPGTGMTERFDTQVNNNVSSSGDSATATTTTTVMYGTHANAVNWAAVGMAIRPSVDKKITEPTNQGLVGYWSLNEGVGNAALDYSGKGNNGALTSGPTWSNGRLGKALSFDGSDDYVDAGSGSSIDDLGPLTLSAWIYPRSLGESNSGIIAGKDRSSAGFWILQFNSSSQFSFTKDYATTDLERAGGEVRLGKWQHAVVTWDGSSTASNVSIYVDGKEISYVTTTNGVDAENSDASINFFIGNNSGGTQTFDGLIDEVRIYNRALSAQEIKTLYQTGAAKIVAPENRGLVGYWNLNEGNGTKALDLSGSRNHGTLTSGPVWVNGRLGKALSFDGSSNYVDLGLGKIGPQLNGATSVTISSWIYPRDSTDGRIHNIVIDYSSGALTGATMGWASGSWRVGGRSITADAFQSTTTTVPLNQWTHIVGIINYSGDNITIYKNGVQVTSTAATFGQNSWTQGTPQAVGNDMLGAYVSLTTEYFNGLADEIRVYNRALSAQEVKTLYQSGAAKLQKM